MRRIRVFSVRANSLAAIAAFYAAHFAVAADAPRTAEELIEQLSSPNIPVRREATYQLEKLGPQAKVAVPALLNVLDDPDKQVWSNALAAIAAIGPDAKDAIPRLLAILGSSKNRSGRSERGQMVVRASYALTQIGPAAVPPLIQALSEDDAALRAGAARALGGMGPAAKEAIPALLANLGRPEAEVQREVVDALGSIGPEALPKLIEALQAQEPRERSGGVLALGAMHRAASGAAPAMMARLDSETDPTVRATLLTALPQIGADPAALVPRLVDSIKDEREPIRHAAVNALLTLQSAQKQVVESLLALLKDPNPAFQERAAYVLGRLGEYAAPAIPEIIATASRANAPPAFQDALVQIGAPAVPVILAGAEHVDEGNITPDFWAVKSLKSMGGVAAIPVSHGLTHPNANARLLAVRVLGELGTDAEAAIPALIQRLDDPDLRVRASALSALIATHAPLKNLQPRLEIAIKDPSPLVRIAALEAVGKLGEDGRSLQPAVVAALREHEETIQRAALGVVGRVFPEAVEPTMVLLANQALRPAAIDALGRIGPAAKDAAEPLAEIARSQSQDDRLHALAAIAQIGPEAKEAAANSLTAACTDADPLIRAAAITATIQISSDDSERLAALGVGLDDPEISVRKATAELVGKLGDKATSAVPQLLALVGKESDRLFVSAALQQIPMRSVPALLELLENPQRDVQILACEKLARLGRTARDANPTLETLATDTDEDLSRAARRALRIINPR